MKTIGNEPAMPTVVGVNLIPQVGEGQWQMPGLTKREKFAAMAMQGYCGGEFTGQSGMAHGQIAEWSVKMADALIEALNK